MCIAKDSNLKSEIVDYNLLHFVVFDLDKLDDGATWEKPTALPTGIDTVIVNGVVTLDGGKHTGARAGAVLRHACRAQS